MNERANVTPIIPEPEELLDARRWERNDQEALFEACLAVVNAGLRNAPQGSVFVRDPRPESAGFAEITVTTWRVGGSSWKISTGLLAKRIKLAKQSRAHRKQVQADLLNEAAAKDAK